MSNLKGKVALVTGASKGIGAAIARELAARGAAVAVNYSSSQAEAEKVVGEIKAAGGKAIPVKANVADPKSIDPLVETVARELGPINVLVNNAGVYEFSPLEAVNPEHFHKQFNLNVLGLLLTTQAAVKHFDPKGGSVINIGSVAAAGVPTASVYSATKGAVDSITVSLAGELGPKKIRVNSLNPGMVETEGVHAAGFIGSDFQKKNEAETPLGRIGQPDDIAGVAAFLASVTADVVCRIMTGETPVFGMHGMPVPSLNALPVALVVGVCAGLGGVLFNRCLLASMDAFDRLRRWPPFLVGALTGLVVGLAAWIYPEVSGSGGMLAEHALTGGFSIRVVVALIAARFALTMVSYGSGSAGGIFAPLLVIGALGGLAVGYAAHMVAPTWAGHPEVFAVLGMGALLTSIVRAPLTGIVLMIELTGKYDYMLPLLVSCFVAYGIAEGLQNVPIYEALRERARGRNAATLPA